MSSTRSSVGSPPAQRQPAASPNGITGMYPGYFALVMATGIIAIAAQQSKVRWLPSTLFAVTAVIYVVLLAMLVLRIVLHTDRFVADLTTHAKGFAFLTLVAGTNILGGAAALVHQWWGLARVLWWCSIPVLVVLLYTSLIADVLRREKPPLGGGINGTWFLVTVSTESVAVLGALLLGHRPGDGLAFAVLAVFLVGVVLYVIVMTMVFLRWTFEPLDPAESDPPAWIAAGAVAITTLAAANLLAARTSSPRIDRVGPFVEGIGMLAWGTATFWFPLMLAISVWRHGARRQPLRYHPSYWSLVFPLGMYAAATYKLRAATQLHELAWVPTLMLWVAVVAWVAGVVALLLSLSQSVAHDT